MFMLFLHVSTKSGFGIYFSILGGLIMVQFAAKLPQLWQFFGGSNFKPGYRIKSYRATFHSRNVPISTPRTSHAKNSLETKPRKKGSSAMAISDFEDLFLWRFSAWSNPQKNSQDLQFASPLPGAMKALRQKLQRHQITRQWVGLDSDKQAVPHDEQELLGDCVYSKNSWSQNGTLILI